MLGVLAENFAAPVSQWQYCKRFSAVPLYNRTLVLVPGLRPFVLVRDYECRVDRVTQICFVYVSVSRCETGP
jgi:hypothetical protein